MGTCSRESCFAPDIACYLGDLDHTKCDSWRGGEDVTASKDEANTQETLLPWSGSALGLVDLGFVAGRSKPLVVGIVGPQNAGKTTLLAAWYLLIGKGQIPGNRQFAGSYSLAGWEAVASELRWAPGHAPSFPPHTSSRGGRAPGLLHFDFRHDNGEHRSYVFADAPGEWFKKWAMNNDGSSGARWVSEHADVFILVADCEALTGSSKGTARGSFQLLVHRLAAERGTRPVALVWTKSHIKVASEMEKVIREVVSGAITDFAEFSVSIESSRDGINDDFLELLNWILNVRREQVLLPEVCTTSTDPLFKFGSR